jgi:hypothetical protein
MYVCVCVCVCICICIFIFIFMLIFIYFYIFIFLYLHLLSTPPNRNRDLILPKPNMRPRHCDPSHTAAARLRRPRERRGKMPAMPRRRRSEAHPECRRKCPGNDGDTADGCEILHQLGTMKGTYETL